MQLQELPELVVKDGEMKDKIVELIVNSSKYTELSNRCLSIAAQISNEININKLIKIESE